MLCPLLPSIRSPSTSGRGGQGVRVRRRGPPAPGLTVFTGSDPTAKVRRRSSPRPWRRPSARPGAAQVGEPVPPITWLDRSEGAVGVALRRQAASSCGAGSHPAITPPGVTRTHRVVGRQVAAAPRTCVTGGGLPGAARATEPASRARRARLSRWTRDRSSAMLSLREAREDSRGGHSPKRPPRPGESDARPVVECRRAARFWSQGKRCSGEASRVAAPGSGRATRCSSSGSSGLASRSSGTAWCGDRRRPRGWAWSCGCGGSRSLSLGSTSPSASCSSTPGSGHAWSTSSPTSA